LKLKKKYKFIVYKLNDDNSVVVVEKTVEGGTYDDFIKAMPKGECRYAVFDFEFEKPGEGLRHKICFFAWLV
jgi:cofilin